MKTIEEQLKIIQSFVGDGHKIEIQEDGFLRVYPKGSQSWIFIGRIDAEAEILILRAPDMKNWLIGKDPDAGKDWRQEETGMTEDKMDGGCHYWLDGPEFEQAPEVGDGQGSLACCSPWGRKELDTAERLNWTELRLWSTTGL